jgi:hypothetical protein
MKDNDKPLIPRTYKSVRSWQRFKTDHPNERLRAMTADQKIQHCRDSVCNALMQVAIDAGRGRPPMIERLRAAANMVDELVSIGVPFGVGRNSKMNKEIRVRLHEEALRSTDNRKSRCKQITADAAREMLRQIRWLRFSSNHFTKMFPYSE